MPPAGSARPSREEADDFIQTLTQKLDAVAPAPAPVMLSRLNRTEYANVIRDLLGLEIDSATLLLDLNVSGAINSTDIVIVKSLSGDTVP